MATLALQQVTPGGLGVTYTAAGASGDLVPCGEHNVLHVKNGSGSAVTVTVDSVTPCSQGFDHNLVVSVAAGAEQVIGPLGGRFAASGNVAAVTYSSNTSVTVAAVGA